MALLDRLASRIEQRASQVAEDARRTVAFAIAEFPDIMLRREGDAIVISGRGLMRRWMNDVRLRFAYWRRG